VIFELYKIKIQTRSMRVEGHTHIPGVMPTSGRAWTVQYREAHGVRVLCIGRPRSVKCACS